MQFVGSIPTRNFPSQGVPHWQVKWSGVRQSKIYEYHLALTGGKGLKHEQSYFTWRVPHNSCGTKLVSNKMASQIINFVDSITLFIFML